MTRRTGKKKMTLSEHLALRAKEAEEAKARDEEHQRYIQNIRKLDALGVCNCPACVRLRQLNKR